MRKLATSLYGISLVAASLVAPNALAAPKVVAGYAAVGCASDTCEQAAQNSRVNGQAMTAAQAEELYLSGVMQDSDGRVWSYRLLPGKAVAIQAWAKSGSHWGAITRPTVFMLESQALTTASASVLVDGLYQFGMDGVVYLVRDAIVMQAGMNGVVRPVAGFVKDSVYAVGGGLDHMFSRRGWRKHGPFALIVGPLKTVGGVLRGTGDMVGITKRKQDDNWTTGRGMLGNLIFDTENGAVRKSFTGIKNLTFGSLKTLGGGIGAVAGSAGMVIGSLVNGLGHLAATTYYGGKGTLAFVYNWTAWQFVNNRVPSRQTIFVELLDRPTANQHPMQQGKATPAGATQQVSLTEQSFEEVSALAIGMSVDVLDQANLDYKELAAVTKEEINRFSVALYDEGMQYELASRVAHRMDVSIDRGQVAANMEFHIRSSLGQFN